MTRPIRIECRRPAACTALLAGLVLAFDCGPAPDPPLPPDPDTTGFERPVADEIGRRRGDVLAALDSGERWGHYGELLFAHDLVQDSLTCFLEAERLEPQQFRWPYLAAQAMIDTLAEETLAKLMRARQLGPDYVPVNVRVGELLLSLGRADDAETYFEHAYELDPESSHALLGLGRIAYSRGDLDAARDHLEEALEHWRSHREVHAALIPIYRELGLADRQRRAAERAARYSENTFLPDPVLESIQEEGTSAVHLARRGKKHLRQGELDDAVELLRLAHETRPEYFDVRIDLACALILRGDEQEGVAMLREVDRLAPGFIDVDEVLEELREERDGGD